MGIDLDAYRAEAEEFLSALDWEYYLHFSGQHDEYAIEPIYERHRGLFTRQAVDGLRECGAARLLEFAVQGLVGRETKAEEAELARREAALEIQVNGHRLPFREAPVVQANEGDPDCRAEIESARNAAIEEHLNPLLRQLLERSHAVAGELGWPSMLAMCQELSGIDLQALGAQTAELLDATDQRYRQLAEPELRQQLGFGFDGVRRADLPALFRAPSLDRWFPDERLVPSLVETLAGMGIDVGSQPGVRLDTEHRPKKSPRAFCSPVRVPGEVYLVISPIGGRDDYAALFHEAGHTEHYANTQRSLPAEARYLGDNSVTEAFAFLFEHLVDDPEWLRRRMGIEEPDGVVSHARAMKLLFLRRYCAKLGYELELHGSNGSLDQLPARYARGLSEALGLEWTPETWLSDVDAFFYSARYLRAWALETHLRRALHERFGPAWFEDPAAGRFLLGLWRHGQRMCADGLLAALEGETDSMLSFEPLVAELG